MRITYPAELPITARRTEIAETIAAHQVVVVAGETGSGKTTQLPKICLELGRGRRAMIGHTQPRRLAARTVSARIAEELGVPLGAEVGYAVRFDERVSAETSVKLMTDGILLTEIQRDRQLRRYDTIVVDEAHERTLNVDFLLGYLKRLLPRRPDLKVVITSATIDPERFAAHFGNTPIIEVSGRTYPVEVRYRPVVDPDDPSADPDRDMISAITAAVDELAREGPGDMLVFLSGEREIRDAADALRGHTQRWREPVEVLPLYSRLPTAEQQRVFADHAARRIVLATNVAETSLTVPGIHYVIDPGTARMSRYNTRTKVQRLPIEPISQASANQRSGRCGRVADGVCIRLYSEADFASRPEFTQPEILRTNLASVILQMAALRLGDVADFPFLDPPDRRQITDGRTVLTELGALDGDRLTRVGRQLAQLPVDPRLARMIVAGAAAGCLREVLVVAAGLAIQDPRERPVDQQPAADAKHRRFTDPTSDFMSMLGLWRYLREQQKALSGNAFRRLCRTDFLNYLRVREWQDVESQLRQTAKALGMPRGPATDDADAIHRALLAGLLSHVGAYDERTRDYQGARGSRFVIFPGSALARRRPDWVVAAELVETSRLFARVCARIEPDWVEQAAGNLVRRSYSEPRWSKQRGSVVATERVTLFGLPLVTDRTVGYGRIEPEFARELFIRHALVEGEWETRHQFFHDNARARAAAEELEERSRRRGLATDDEALFAFYDARIPAEVVSARHFDAWWKKARRDNPDLLRFTPKPVAAEAEIDDDFPASWPWAGADLRLSYVFDPADPRDGVAVHIPLTVLAGLPTAPFEWQVPGLREELVAAMIRSLPKPIRRRLVPAPDLARAFLAGPGRAGPDAGPLPDVLATTLADWRGVSIRPGDWQLDALPAHLRMTFVVEDDAGAVLAEGKDLDALRMRLSAAALAEVSADFEPLRGRTSWDFGALPEVYETERGGHRVRAYPALVDEGTSVAVQLVAGPAEQRAANHDGVRRLLLLAVPSPINAAVRALTSAERMVLRVTPHGSAAELLDDCLAAAADAVMDGGPLPHDAASFDALVVRARAELPSVANRLLREVAAALAAYGEARLAVDRVRATTAAEDMDAQLGRLVHPGFVIETTAGRLPDLARYLRAITIRAGHPGARDAELTARAQLLEHEYADVVQSLPPDRRADPDIHEVRWLLEELRVSFFAQRLGTRVPVSEKRVQRAIDAL
ncbi:MAG TPA: ATP-dependent RNA helicase HrpA [Jatrophihabitantaceae bacterium]|nr:ATP-dependent RNA helicase HrpA [Jatrophihabitantaceae bacterium]